MSYNSVESNIWKRAQIFVKNDRKYKPINNKPILNKANLLLLSDLNSPRSTFFKCKNKIINRELKSPKCQDRNCYYCKDKDNNNSCFCSIDGKTDISDITEHYYTDEDSM